MSLLHRNHPWIGRDVEDTATGRRGTLRAIARDDDEPRPVAWLLPPGGGAEWATEPNAFADPITPDTTHERTTAEAVTAGPSRHLAQRVDDFQLPSPRGGLLCEQGWLSCGSGPPALSLGLLARAVCRHRTGPVRIELQRLDAQR
ncbi:hypothetical protein [Streptomyces odonnellii]|uniref:hypothetical protein n=1 Tax=Streptomyces odonnellii TaxID=1417980 RepID=UPI000AFB7275|nr:hypothetical protein [Streptomyces odonnellii]